MTDRRRAVSLVEAVIGLAIGICVLSILWMVFRMNAVQRHRADVKMQGLTHAIPAVDLLEQDGRCLFLSPTHGIELNPGGHPGVAFHVKSGGTVTPVSWFLDRSTLGLYRTVGDGPPHRFNGIFEDFLVGVTPPLVAWNAPPWTAEPPSPVTAGSLLTWVVVALPLEYEVTERRLWKPQDRTTLVGAIPVRPLDDQNKYFFWNPTVLAPGGTE